MFCVKLNRTKYDLRGRTPLSGGLFWFSVIFLLILRMAIDNKSPVNRPFYCRPEKAGAWEIVLVNLFPTSFSVSTRRCELFSQVLVERF